MGTESYCKLRYFLSPNTLPEGKGRYHGTFVSNGTTDLDALAERMAASAGIRPAAVKLVVRSMYAKVAELVSTRLCRVAAGQATFEPQIGGSFDSANASVGEGNDIYVAVRLSDALQGVAAGITPTKIDAASATSRLDMVENGVDGAQDRISGTDPFVLTGWNMSACGEGEGVSVKGRDGRLHPAETLDESHGQRITARLSEAMPDGAATVVLTTRGWNTPDGDVRTMAHRVTVIAGTPPTPTGDEPVIERGYSAGTGHPDGQIFSSCAFILQGLNLTGASVKIGYIESGDTPREVDVPDEKLTVTDTVIEIASDSVELEDAIAAGGTVTFKVTTEHGTATYEAEVQE